MDLSSGGLTQNALIYLQIVGRKAAKDDATYIGWLLHEGSNGRDRSSRRKVLWVSKNTGANTGECQLIDVI
jgi:hypothetical protein